MFSNGITKTITMLSAAILLFTQSLVTIPNACICTPAAAESDVGAKADAEQNCCSSASAASGECCCRQAPKARDCGCSEEPVVPGARNDHVQRLTDIAAASHSATEMSSGLGPRHVLQIVASTPPKPSVSVRVRCCIWQT
jgi:hypothetical protein